MSHSIQQATESDELNLSDLEQKDVYTMDSKFVGTIQHPVVDFTDNSVTGLLVNNCNRDLFLEQPPEDIILPYEWVRSAGDVVLVSSIQEDMLTY